MSIVKGRRSSVGVAAMLALLLMGTAGWSATKNNTAPMLFPIVKHGRYGYVDSTGRIAIPARFVWASGFYDGLASVFVCGKEGYIDGTGKLVIPARFVRADPFSENLGRIAVGGKVGFIVSVRSWPS